VTRPGLTPSQTIGPFFHPALLREGAGGNVLVQPETEGERIRIEGQVLDGEGTPVNDASVEVWQANHHGRYHHPADNRDLPLDPSFTGYGRAATDDEGRFWFETIKPGVVPFDDTRSQAPHICLTVFARGLLNHVVTRLYFEDDPATANDPVLQLVPKDRRTTLIARRDEAGEAVVYRLAIRLQGTDETVFLNL
jgi:protocatechuate 3,4-dioxygenase, alpha subunit